MLNVIKKALSNNADSAKIEFKSAGFLTLGAEVELQIINPETMMLISSANAILNDAKKIEAIKPEFYLSTVEINTGKCEDVKAIENDLLSSIEKIKEIATKNNLKLATTGCHPISKYSDCEITPKDRYNEIIDRNQWLTRRMTVYGLHVHIGMKSGEEAIKYMNFFLRFIPHFLALSASSPFWAGEDTGLSSCRPSTYEALPTAGLPYSFESWAEFEALYATLIKCDSIKTINDLWWDIRPAPKFGTIEIRSCDGPATLEETLALVAFIHMLSHWFEENVEWVFSMPRPIHWIMRENKWRAMRYGLEADMVINATGDTKPIKTDILEWVEKLRPYAEKLGYQKYLQTIMTICEKGNSADRQRKIYEQTGSLEKVVEHNISEFEAGKPIY